MNNTRLNRWFLLIVMGVLTCNAQADRGIMREGCANVEQWNTGWRFARYGLQANGTTKAEPEGLYESRYDDASWQKVTLPHDFGITGPFRYDLSGNTGRLPYQGKGWYRKTFRLSEADRGKAIMIDFDGAMAYAKVWLNGHYVGTWPYGYSSFRLDLTPYVSYDGENVMAVSTNTEQWDSRWYSGAGIYRNVWLIRTGRVHVGHWGTSVTTPEVSEESAQIHLKVTVDNQTDAPQAAQVITTLYETNINDELLRKVDTFSPVTLNVAAGGSNDAITEETVRGLRLWSTEHPNRYMAETRVLVGGQETDRYYTPFGVRNVVINKQGFFLNGQRVAMKGVCQHHDLGAIGAAFNKSAMKRQLLMLQSMGCNALRTSHNPPAPEVLELCDKLGIVVMDEAFDAWKHGKRQWDYSKLFDEWHEKDLQALVSRDRNHPCVVLWSIGNEVYEQSNKQMTQELVNIVHKADPTRMVTEGCNDPDGARSSNAATELDVMGVNYNFRNQKKWDEDNRYVQKPTVGTETASCISSRGVYFFDGKKRGDYQVTSYDTDQPGWGAIPDKQFAVNAAFPDVMGEFVWTGFDYIGEPTPYNSDDTNLLNFRNDPAKMAELQEKLKELERKQPPSRSSYFGIIDLAGFPKDRFYLYQSQWAPQVRMAHILPHWNWPDRIGKNVPVHVYTSGDEAELFVNGKSYGRKQMEKGKTFRLVWDTVTYQPGTVKVIAYKNGSKWAEDEVTTSGDATAIQLTTDKKVINNDGYEYAFITAKVMDSKGRFVPTAQSEITFTVSGSGEMVATDNGDATSFVPFQSPVKKAFNGLALVIVRAKAGSKGAITVKAASAGLKVGNLSLQTKPLEGNWNY